MKNSALWNELIGQIEEELVFLPDKPEENAKNTLAALWLKAQGVPVSAVRAEHAQLSDLSEPQIADLRAYLSRRISGEPLAHITGRQDFFGVEFVVGPEALVPRRETELLAGAALAKAREAAMVAQPLTIIDVCTGSGNVALELVEHLQRDNIQARVFAADLSEDAVRLARQNAQSLGLERAVEFYAGDLMAPFDLAVFANGVDLLTCNPPYINQAKVELMPAELSSSEPRLAFDGGPFGVSILMRLVEEAPRYLKTGGWLAFEVGHGQGRSMTRYLERSGAFADIQASCDDSGEVRAICARKI
ncbi:MAG TPA: peptide chain release factor N(5)-glutamine methyltransferase [Spongiibacteraceae bacterium]|nr:peptide chain release factor N(5)-glutamine methyltransferase [Spongiibacteraceae bacterium]